VHVEGVRGATQVIRVKVSAFTTKSTAKLPTYSPSCAAASAVSTLDSSRPDNSMQCGTSATKLGGDDVVEQRADGGNTGGWSSCAGGSAACSSCAAVSGAVDGDHSARVHLAHPAHTDDQASW
jgi:hypothetical protein